MKENEVEKMARKKVEKILTEEEKMNICVENYFQSHEERTNEPTYIFNVGDEVKYGGFNKSEIKRVVQDGRYYVLYTTSIKERSYGEPEITNEYKVVPWHSVRRIDTKATNFTDDNKLDLNFLHVNVESLLGYYYGFGIDMEPEYQRDLVWDDKDKEKLLDSIFYGTDIGKFVFVHLSDEEWFANGQKYSYEILDGKQRLSTLIEFYEDRFLYHGCTYSDLSKRDKYTFRETSVALAKVTGTTMKDRYKIFLKVNNSGKAVSEEQLRKVEMLYENC